MPIAIPIGHSPLPPYGSSNTDTDIDSVVILQWQCPELGISTFSVTSSFRAPATLSDRDSNRDSSRGSVTLFFRDGRDGTKAGRRSVRNTVPMHAGCGGPC